MVRGLFVLLCVALACASIDQDSLGLTWVDTVYTTTMTFSQVEPKTNVGFTPQADRLGICICQFDRNMIPRMSLDCEIWHNIISPLSISISLGTRGRPNVRTLYSFDAPLHQHMRQVFYFEDFSNYSVYQQELDFLNGHWYIQIDSHEFPLGEIRGQLEHQDSVLARLRGSSVEPISLLPQYTGGFLGVISKNEQTLNFDVSHTVIDAVNARMNHAPHGQNGPLVFIMKVQKHTQTKLSLVPSSTRIIEKVDLTPTEMNYLLDDLFYFSISTEDNLDGVVRGNLYTIEDYPKISFTSRLVPLSGGNAAGCALVQFHCDTNRFEYLLIHNVINPVGAGLYGGVASENTAIKKGRLSRVNSPIFGSRQLPYNEKWLLYDQNLYFRIDSIEHPQGEIAGQISVDADWAAYLTGRQCVPPVSTAAVGCATMTLDYESRTITSLDIHHTIPVEKLNIQATVEIRGASEDQTGHEILTVARGVQCSSPILGYSGQLDDDDYFNVVEEDSYLVIKTADYPLTGEIRGSFYRVDPCLLE